MLERIDKSNCYYFYHIEDWNSKVLYQIFYIISDFSPETSSIADIFNSSSIPNLEYLNLQECHQPTSSIFLRGMPNLKCLILEGCDNVEVAYEDLFSIPNLEVLNLNRMRFNWEPVSQWHKFRHKFWLLIWLSLFTNLSFCLNSVQALKTVLPKLSKITSLDLQDCSWVTDELMQIVIQYLPRLRRLNISKTSVTDDGFVCTSKDAQTESKECNLNQLQGM